MFDTLTLDGLYDFHTSLYQQHNAIHARLVGPDHQPLIDPMTPEWDLLSAKEEELGETMRAVYAEINRREQEARTDADLISEAKDRGYFPGMDSPKLREI